MNDVRGASDVDSNDDTEIHEKKESLKLTKFLLLDRHNKFRAQYSAHENFGFFKGHYFNNEKVVDFCLRNLKIFEAGLNVSGLGLRGTALEDYFKLNPDGMRLTTISDSERNECIDYCSWLRYAMNSTRVLSDMENLLTFRILMRFLVSETYGISILQYKTMTSENELQVKIHELREINSILEASLQRTASKIEMLQIEGKRNTKERAIVLQSLVYFVSVVKTRLWPKAKYFSTTKYTGIYADKAEPNPLLSAPLCIAMLDAALFGECSDVPLKLSPSPPRITIYHLRLFKKYYIDVSDQKKTISYFFPKLRFFEPIGATNHGISSDFYTKMRKFLNLYDETNAILERINLDTLYTERQMVKKRLDDFCFLSAKSYASKVDKLLKGPANCFYDIDKDILRSSSIKLFRLVRIASDCIAFVNTFVPYVARLIRLTRVSKEVPDLCSFTSRISNFEVKSVFPHIIWTL